MKRLLERLEGLWRHLREHPAAIWLFGYPVVAVRLDSPAIPVSLRLSTEQADHHRRDIGQRFAITWHEGIQIDQVSNALRRLIKHAGDNHCAITVTHQDNTMQILFLKQANNILDMGLQS